MQYYRISKSNNKFQIDETTYIYWMSDHAVITTEENDVKEDDNKIVYTKTIHKKKVPVEKYFDRVNKTCIIVKDMFGVLFREVSESLVLKSGWTTFHVDGYEVNLTCGRKTLLADKGMVSESLTLEQFVKKFGYSELPYDLIIDENGTLFLYNDHDYDY